MSKIEISNLQPASSHLFSESKNYFKHLDVSEQNIQGGYIFHLAFAIGFAIGYNL
jgi:hypothetical protein